uniref:FAS1 domain-containing protein n=1 Tax=Kalanchoe fedtschenkoi TaxID=63787 RepID=A0A7N0RGV6_KALFE
MESSSSLKHTLALSLLLLLLRQASPFDIAKMLSQFPDLSSFSNLLSQSQVAAEINSRQTITVLALDNGAVSQISSKPADVAKRILQVHVILDYYDKDKLTALKDKTALLTTLFQASGQATGQQGFVNVTVMESGTVAFGSAVSGSGLNANLVKAVVSQPYNVSVLQISSAIVPPGIDGSSKSPPGGGGGAPASSPASSSSGTPPPTPASSTTAPSPSTGAPPPKAKSPAPSSPAPASSPPTAADAPDVSDAPTGAAPAGTPAGAPVADAPTADGPGPAAVETPADGSSAGRVGGVGVVAGTLLNLVIGAVV